MSSTSPTSLVTVRLFGLHEADDWDPDDFLGEQVVTRQHIGHGEIELPFKEDDANYSIWVKVLDDRPEPKTKR